MNMEDIAIQEGRRLESFTFWQSYLDAIEKCPKRARLELYKAITDYAFLGKETTQFSDKMAELAWIGMRQIVRKGRVKALNRKDKDENEPKTN
ncbi:MAG: hypothetical protein IJ650_05380 [Paludibacteraceae bacterium]|nr:hypothetical protein [Paludibacteraceae bacterium]